MEAILQKLTGIQISLPALLLGLLMAGLILLGVCLDLTLLIYWSVRSPNWAGKLRRFLATPWRPIDGVGVLALCGMLIAYSVLGLLLQNPQPEPDIAPPPSMYALVLQSLFFPSLALGLLWLLLRRRGISAREAFSPSSKGSVRVCIQAAACYVGALPLLVVVSLFWHLLLDRMGYDAPKQEVVLWMADPANPLGMKLYMCFMAVVIAPLVEELLFRGVLLPSLLRQVRLGLAVAFVSIFFASIHLNVQSFAPLATIAAAFSFGYLHSGDIRVPILAHALFNGVTLLAVTFLPPDLITAFWLPLAGWV